ncbi:MAG: class I SAM-dependent methyltransferase [Nitrospirae bacterium]|nr:class I SAM-dependent methyltransferase [Nitrospirota bacterium]
MSADYSYVGTELEIFNEAVNWKRYFTETIEPFLGNNVLEVGAGIGGTTKSLCRKHHHNWVCIEPDAVLADQIEQKISNGILPSNCSVRNMFVSDLPETETYDTIIYVDVIEHIKDDFKEIEMVKRLLKKNGFLIILVPAYMILYSEFDSNVGHYRRYNKKTLQRIIPETFKTVQLLYLDSVGLLASLANRLFFRQEMPSMQQINKWDKYIIPISKITDPLVKYKAGRSLVGVWQNL